MYTGKKWVIVDTETTGFKNPVYPVEIAAQKMAGWEPTGKPFRIFLNFDVPIERGAEKAHGYSREYLRAYGSDPKDAFSMFMRYVEDLPVVAYNLSYDFGRVLRPTLERMEWDSLPVPGFCVLNLSRKLMPYAPNFKLETIVKILGIEEEQKHHAGEDVNLVVSLLSRYFGPHLTWVNIKDFDSVVACSEGQITVPPLEIASPPKKQRPRKTKNDPETIFAIGELVGICKMIVMDRCYTADEINFLAKWLENCPFAGVSPISKMFEVVQTIVADGRVTKKEQEWLTDTIEEVLHWTLTMKK